MQNPTTHYFASDGGVISGNPNTWIDKGTIKSIYDPCPYGYRVPKEGSWAGFHGKSWAEGTINEGQLWQFTWWPAAGERYSSSATMVYVGSYGYCWSSSPNGSGGAYDLYFSYAGTVAPSGGSNRSYGYSLRCVQE